MIFEGLILGIIIGRIRGGNLRYLTNFIFRSSLLLVFALILQLGTSILVSIGNETAINNKMILYTLSYVMLFIALFFNFERKSVWIIFIGAVANFVALALNKGSIPINAVLLEKMGFENMLQSFEIGAMPNYIDIGNAHSFSVHLAKKFTTPAYYPLKQIFSIGDILISLGLLIFVQSVMQIGKNRHSSNTVTLNYESKEMKS